MKLALATLLLPSMASLPYATARVGLKTLKLNSQKPLDPNKGHLASKPTLEESEEHRTLIIGGEEGGQGEFPFYVKWLDKGLCGGSLIHEDIILTAAHCGDIGTNVIIGTTSLFSSTPNEEIRQIETIKVHPNYIESNKVNDVMVLKITSPSSLPPVALNNDSASPTVGQDVVAIGFGDTLPDRNENTTFVSNVLLKVTVPIVAHDQCAADYVDFNPVVEDVMLCAGLKEGGKDSCQGDSGGPLLELRGDKYVQVGITSWGEFCGQPNSPGVYTRVSGVKSWIDEMICELSDNPPASCDSTPTPPPSTPSSSLPFMCNVCGDNQVITIPDGIVSRTNEFFLSCSELEAKGNHGQISEDQCPLWREWLGECGCSMPPTRHLRRL